MRARVCPTRYGLLSMMVVKISSTMQAAVHIDLHIWLLEAVVVKARCNRYSAPAGREQQKAPASHTLRQDRLLSKTTLRLWFSFACGLLVLSRLLPLRPGSIELLLELRAQCTAGARLANPAAAGVRAFALLPPWRDGFRTPTTIASTSLTLALLSKPIEQDGFSQAELCVIAAALCDSRSWFCYSCCRP